MLFFFLSFLHVMHLLLIYISNSFNFSCKGRSKNVFYNQGKINEKLKTTSRKLFIIRFNVTARTSADFSCKRCNVKSLKPAAQQNNMIQSYKCNRQLRKRTSGFHRNEMKDKKNDSACCFGNVDFPNTH